MSVHLSLSSVHRLASASPARRSSENKRSNRGLFPECGVVGTCVRKGKRNDFENKD